MKLYSSIKKINRKADWAGHCWDYMLKHCGGERGQLVLKTKFEFGKNKFNIPTEYHVW